MLLKYVCEKEMMVKEYLEYVGISHHLRKKVRALDNIIVNGEKQRNYYVLHVGDVLELEFNEDINDKYPLNDNEELDIVYEDEYMIIVNKRRDLSIQPSRLHLNDNLLSIAKSYFIKNNINANIHLVNRLDYQTSGLVIISKSGICHNEMTKIKIAKKYLCLVNGIFDNGEGIIDLPIKREDPPSILRYVSPDGVKAITKYKTLKKYDDKSLLEVELVTGRCHQIRVHMAYNKHSIIGDKLYGKCNDGDFLHLHAYSLSFIHPFTKEKLSFEVKPDWLNL